MDLRFDDCFRSNFQLSANGFDSLDDEKKMSDYQLIHGQTLQIFTEVQNQSSSSIPLDQPLTLDEVRDCHVYPLSVHRLMEDSHPENDFDFIVIALHALMLESGFQMVKK